MIHVASLTFYEIEIPKILKLNSKPQCLNKKTHRKVSVRFMY